MSDLLYAKELLRLAAAATGAGRLEPCDAQGAAWNPTCGDRVSVTLDFAPDGSIARLAHETQACVLAQASATILAAQLPGHRPDEIEGLRTQVLSMLQGEAVPPAPFEDYATLRGAAQHRNRHKCVLLPLDAVVDALKKVSGES
jgi:nitrogen fixation protein NifU and related proteins